MKCNLGCGAQIAPGWVNVDYSLGARFMKVPLFSALNRKIRLFNMDWNPEIYLHDLTKRFPWADGTADAIYASHTLEHFSRDDGRRFLAECHRVLKNNGILRVVVPDLRHYVTEYMEGRLCADDFIETLGVLYEKKSGALKKALVPFVQFPHKCMYDTSRLLAIMEEVGFDAGAKLAFESAIEDIEQVELAGRTEAAVIVEGRKRS